MEYKEFLMTIKKSFHDRLGKEYGVILRKVLKNNGVNYDGLCILQGLEGVGAVICLNSYYEQFKEGIPLGEIIELINTAFLDSIKEPELNPRILDDFDLIKDKIVYQLVNTKANEELLEAVPSIPFLDLSIIFNLFLTSNEFGHMSAMISKENMEAWKIDVDVLYQHASVNTPGLLPAIISDLSKGLKTYMNGQYKAPFFVLTNNMGVNGSSTLLYDGLLRKFADSIGQDFIILPICIHEIILLPLSNKKYLQQLHKEQTRSVNTYLPLAEWLSSQVYFYSKAEERMILADML